MAISGDYEYVSEELEQEILATDPTLAKYRKDHRFICPNFLDEVSFAAAVISTQVCEIKTPLKKPYEPLKCPEANAGICWKLFIKEIKTTVNK